ncbi:TapB family protein [Pseudochryseolinea flava]|nr:hypothetical protein [Pseudochryseolinea flava]
MKILVTMLMAIAIISSAAAQCNQFYPIQNGSYWEMETYNGKGKLTGKNQQRVIQYNGTASGFTATINSTTLNEKGKELMKGDLELKCAGGTVYIDMRNFINEDQMKALQSYELKVESENLELPSALSVGQTLKNGTVTLTATNAPMPMKMTVNITDRKVEAKESVTTPAGTFDCYKITSKGTFKNQMGINMTFEFSTVEWLAPKVGMVKTESYNKNGKLNGSTVLTKRT